MKTTKLHARLKKEKSTEVNLPAEQRATRL